MFKIIIHMEKTKKFYKINQLGSRTSIQMVDDSLFLRTQTDKQKVGKMGMVPTEEESISGEASLQPFAATLSSSLVSSRRYRKKPPSSKQSSTRAQEVLRKKQHFEKPEVQKVVRITDLIRLFYDKLTCNSVLRVPVEYDPLNVDTPPAFFLSSIRHISLPHSFQLILLCLRILFIVSYFFVYPLSLLYPILAHSSLLFSLKILGVALGFFDLLDALHLPTNQSMQPISRILLQILVFATTIISTTSCQNWSTFLFLGMGLKTSRYLEMIEQVQGEWFSATHYEQYWDLAKVLCMNLLVGHLLACLLIAMTFCSEGDSWMNQSNISDSVWYEQYIWSYYFGTTIILTIGFGDLHPANCLEAFFIIFISFFACVFFGYNINYIGNLINSIRQSEVEKDGKLKVLGSLAKKAHLSKTVHAEITNYIVQQSKIKQESNYTQEKKLLQELPDTLRSAFLQEANKKLFHHLKKLIPFTNRTIEKLSLRIEARICHPQQIIRRPLQTPSLTILQSGEVGFIARAKDSRLNNAVIETIACNFDQQSKIICADLLSGEAPNYDIKSIAYSIIYEIGRDAFEDCLSYARQDYEIYREVLDRCRYKMNEFALTKCKFCPNKLHSLFDCPRLHYMPFRKFLPLKKITHGSEKQDRVKFIRNKKQMDFEFAGDMRYGSELNSVSMTESLRHIKPRQQGIQSRQVKSTPTHHSHSSRQGRESFLLTLQMVTQIREEIKSLKSEKTSNSFEFTLWANIDCDEACNFKYYFPRGNPNSLDDKAIKNNLIIWTRNMRKKLKKPQSN